MNNLDRLNLIDSIASELQDRMTFADIDAYLPGFSIDLSKPWSGKNSKRIYVKEMLADAPASTVITIASELGIPHTYALTPVRAVVESAFWKPNSFRLFLSHISAFKVNAGYLQKALEHYGISAFVAHVDIEPTKEWLDEIEAALFSMDALAALLIPGFKESNWTDHEIGVAVGRGVLVVPVMRGLTPYGFVGKYQGLNAHGKTVGQVADCLFNILLSAPQTRPRMLTTLSDQVVGAATEADAERALGILERVVDLPQAYAERIRVGAESSALFQSLPLQVRLNAFLKSHSVPMIGVVTGTCSDSDDEIPF